MGCLDSAVKTIPGVQGAICSAVLDFSVPYQGKLTVSEGRRWQLLSVSLSGTAKTLFRPLMSLLHFLGAAAAPFLVPPEAAAPF